MGQQQLKACAPDAYPDPNPDPSPKPSSTPKPYLRSRDLHAFLAARTGEVLPARHEER